MQKTDLELQEAINEAMEFVFSAWCACDDECAAADLIAQLTARGYKIVKDTD